jgi:DNA-binding MarR family transcriptional regulator
MSAPPKPSAAQRKRDLVGRLSGLTRRYQRAVDAMDQALAEAFGVNRTDLRCLDLLFDRELAVGELARNAGLSPQAATTMVDRLQAAGYIERVPDRADRRRSMIRTTPGFRKAAGKALAAFIEDVSAVAGRRSTSELEVLVAFFAEVCEIRERHTAALRSRPHSHPTPGTQRRAAR